MPQLQGAVAELEIAVQRVASCIGTDTADGRPRRRLDQIREVGIDPLEAAFASGLRRFDKAGEYTADGALSAVAWVRERCNLSAGAAAQRVNVARQFETLPQIARALASGDVGFQHVVLIARAAESVGSRPVQKEEGNLLEPAQTMDPGRFAAVAKGFELRVDAAAALEEANHAHQRRYFHISEPQDGMVRLDGILDVLGRGDAEDRPQCADATSNERRRPDPRSATRRRAGRPRPAPARWPQARHGRQPAPIWSSRPVPRRRRGFRAHLQRSWRASGRFPSRRHSGTRAIRR